MEYCDGGSTADIYQDLEHHLAEDAIVLVCRETLKGLAYLHSVGFMHRDIKGANIMVKRDGSVKLIDFGVSGKVSAASPTRRTFIGTPYWMAPEVIANKTSATPYDCRADVWSLGITLIELAQADPPLADINPMKALFQIPYRNPPTLARPDKWSPEFNDFVAKCLVKRPQARWTVDQLLHHPWLDACQSPRVLVDLVERYLVAKALRDAEDAEQPMEEQTEEERQAAALLETVENSRNLVRAPETLSPLPTLSLSPSPSPSPSPPPPPPPQMPLPPLFQLTMPPPPPILPPMPQQQQQQPQHSFTTGVVGTPPAMRMPTMSTPSATPLIGRRGMSGTMHAPAPSPPPPPTSHDAARPKAAAAATTGTARPRTVHHGTARRTAEIKQNITRQLLRKQVAEIKAMTKQQQKELDLLAARQGEQKGKLVRMYNERLAADQKKRGREDEQANKRATTERENETKRHRAELDTLTKRQQTAQKAWHRERAADEKTQQKDFEEQAAQRAREFKEHEKGREKDDKAEREKKVREHKKQERKKLHAQEETYLQTVFRQKLEMERLGGEHAQHHRQLDETQDLKEQQRRAHFAAEYDVLQAAHARQQEMLQAEHALRTEELQRTHECEVEAMKQTQEVMLEQLQKRFALENEQLKRQQVLEQRDAAKELRATQKKRLDEFNDRLRGELKNAADKKHAKQEQKGQKEQFVRGLHEEEESSSSAMHKRMAEEDESLRHTHQDQMRAITEAQSAELQDLLAAHQDAMRQHNEAFRVRTEELCLRQCRELAALLRDEQRELTDGTRAHIDARAQARADMHAKEREQLAALGRDLRDLNEHQQQAAKADMDERHHMQLELCDKDKKHTTDRAAVVCAQEADHGWLETQLDTMSQRVDAVCRERQARLDEQQAQQLHDDADAAQQLAARLNSALQAEHARVAALIIDKLHAHSLADTTVDIPPFVPLQLTSLSGPSHM